MLRSLEMSTDYYAELDRSFRSVKRHVLSYERDSIRLQFYATNVLLHSDQRTSGDLTLIVCHGLAMSTWISFFVLLSN